MYEEWIVSGSGGQGVLVLGEALAIGNILNGGKSTWLPAYGATMRGGTANCSVVTADTEIGSPMVEEPNVLVCFNQPSLAKFSNQVSENGVIFANSDATDDYSAVRGDVQLIKVPAQSIANALGNERCVNTVMLGAVIKKCPVITIDLAKRALVEVWGESKAAKLMPINEKAIQAGFDAV